MRRLINKQKGQALVTLLFIALIGITVTISAAVFIFQNIKATSITEDGVDAYYIAEAGIQEALLRKIRFASYSGTLIGQPLQVGGGTVEIAVSTASGIITAIGRYNNSVRKLQAKTVYNEGVLIIQSWKEIK